MKRSRLPLLATFCMATNCYAALDFETQLKLDVEHSDNMAQLPSPDETPDTLLSPTLKIQGELDYRNFVANANYSATYRDYRADSFPDRTDVIGESNVRAVVLRDRLFWNLYHNSNRLTIDSRELDTPANTTTRQVIQTGPEARLQLGARVSVVVAAEYVQSVVDGPQLPDTKQESYRLELNRAAGMSQWSLFGKQADITFQTSSFDYQTTRYGIRFNRSGKSIQLGASVGRNSVDRSLGTSFSGLFTSINLSRITADDSLSLNVVRELTDSSIGLSLNSDLQDRLDPGDTNLSNTDIVERRRIDLAYSRAPDNAKISFTLRLHTDEQDFQTLDTDQKTVGGTASIRYRFSRKSNLTYLFAYSAVDIDAIAAPTEEIRDKRHRLSLSTGVSQNLQTELWIEKKKRAYASPGRNFTAASVGISVGYTF